MIQALNKIIPTDRLRILESFHDNLPFMYCGLKRSEGTLNLKYGVKWV